MTVWIKDKNVNKNLYKLMKVSVRCAFPGMIDFFLLLSTRYQWNSLYHYQLLYHELADSDSDYDDDADDDVNDDNNDKKFNNVQRSYQYFARIQI